MKISINGLKKHAAQSWNKLVAVINDDRELINNEDLIDAMYDLKISIGSLVSLYDDNDPDNTDLDIELDDLEN